MVFAHVQTPGMLLDKHTVQDNQGINYIHLYGQLTNKMLRLFNLQLLIMLNINNICHVVQ